MLPEITGQLIVREPGGNEANRGRKLIAFCGIIAVPQDSDLSSEHQYVLSGNAVGDKIELTLWTESGQDLTPELRGKTYDNMLTSPIWRH